MNKLLTTDIISNWISHEDPEYRRIACLATQCQIFEISNVVKFLQKAVVPKISKLEDYLFEREGFKLPYPHCSFEFDFGFTSDNKIPRKDCVIFSPENEEGFHFTIIYRVGDIMIPVVDKGHLLKHPDIENGKKTFDELIPTYEIHPNVLKRFKSKSITEADLVAVYRADLWHVQYAIKLLNCKNIRTAMESTHRGLSKKERKNWVRHGAEVEYKVLNVPLINRIANGEIKVSEDNKLPLHTVRGHFKEYTVAKPLLGKHVGRYWWSNFMRGDIENGAVEKTYDVSPATA